MCSDSESEDEISVDDLVKLVAEKEDLLMVKHKQIEEMKDKVLRSYAEMENVMDRTRREAENAKKYAIQVCFVEHLHFLLFVAFINSVLLSSFA